MPIAHFHVVDPTPAQQRELLVRGSQAYAEAFESPLDRVRVFVHSYPANAAAVGGVPVAEGPPRRRSSPRSRWAGGQSSSTTEFCGCSRT